MTLRTLVLLRHGETDYNATSRMQGQLDSQLTELGLAQARRAAAPIAGYAPDVLVTSDLTRAADTAAVLAAETGLVPMLDKRLRETHLGEWQGLTQHQMETTWPSAIGQWRVDPAWAPPGGESRIEVAARGMQVIETIEDAGHRVAVCCAHGGLIAGLTAQLLGLPHELWHVLGGIHNCHWTVLVRRRTPSWQPEPAQPEPGQPEPGQPEPGQTEPGQTGELGQPGLPPPEQPEPEPERLGSWRLIAYNTSTAL